MSEALILVVRIITYFILAAIAIMMFIIVYHNILPKRIILLKKRANREPLVCYDRARKFKDSDGVEWFKLYWNKKKVEVPDTEYEYVGKGFCNKSTYIFWEDNNRLTPCKLEFGEALRLMPIDTALERKRLALERYIKLKHETEGWLSKNKGAVISAFVVFVIIVIGIIFLTRGKDLTAQFKDAVGMMIPFMFMRFRK